MSATPTRRSVNPKNSGNKPAVGTSRASNGSGESSTGVTSLEEIMSLGTDTTSAAVAEARTNQTRITRAALKTVQEPETEEATAAAEEAVRQRILTANFESLQKTNEADQADVADAIRGLHEICEKMDIEFQSLTETSPEEIAVVANAEAVVADINQKIEKKKAQKIGWFGARERDVMALQAQLVDAQQDVEEAKKKAEQMKRERLLHASLDASVGTYITASQKTVEILKKSVISMSERIKITEERQEDAQSQKSEANRLLKEAGDKLNELKATLQTLQNDLADGGLVKGTKEYSDKEEEIRVVTNQIENTRGVQNIVLEKFQSKEKRLRELAADLTSLRQVCNTHKALIAGLESDTQERVVIYKNRLECMKRIADQGYTHKLSDVGTEFDRSNLKFMAEATVAASEALVRRFEAQPKILREQAVVINTMARQSAEIHRRTQAVLDQMGDNYGMDPKEASFTNYLPGEEPAADAAEAPPAGNTGT